ncbi:MAG: ABC transporter permease [Anaerolineales bacterium]|nr:ABC transporter permease [Anaerolineales bacterium]
MKRWRLPEEAGVAIILVLVVLVMSILSPNFRTLSNAQILLLNGAVIAFLAMGQTFVLLTGGIDLSTGSNVAMTGVLAAVLMKYGMPWEVASLLAICAGVSLGIVNGFFIHYVGLPAFIVTFSTFGVAASIPLIITGANSVSIKDYDFALVGRGAFLGIPMPVLLVFVAAIILTVILRLTPLGVQIYATGGNAETSRLAGVNIGRTIIVVYAVSGLCAAMGGLITASRLMVGYPSAGSGNELFFSIASAVVGGVSLFGGIGSILGALLGAVLIAAVSNGMNVVGVPSYWQPLVIGLIILTGVTIDTYRRRVSFGELARRFGRRQPQPAAPTPTDTQNRSS